MRANNLAAALELRRAPRLVTRPIRTLGATVERGGVSATYSLHDRLLGNRDARRRFLARPPSLDAVPRRVVDEVRRDGYSVVHFNDLFSDPALWERVQAQGRQFVEDAERAVAE